MRALLTSQMIHNKSIADALADLLGKPFGEARVAYIITAHNGASGDKSWLAENIHSLYNLGWNKFYMIDIAGMNGLTPELWMGQLEEVDVVVMGGGNNPFLSYWLEKTGLIDKLPELIKGKVYVGESAGSMITQKILCTSSQAIKAFARGDWDVDLATLGQDGRSSSISLGLVDFLIRPHYGNDDCGGVLTDELLQKISNKYDMPLYALDNDSAIKIDGEMIEVVSEGNWRKFDTI